MPECPHNDPPTDRIVPDPTARIPFGDAARTPGGRSLTVYFYTDRGGTLTSRR